MNTTPGPTKLGNVWLIAATIAHSIVVDAQTGPQVVTINPDGMLEAVSSSHPEYEERLLSPGFVCTLSGASDCPRIAAKIRAAALATGDT